MANYDAIVQAAAQKYNVDPALIRGIIATESNGDPAAVGRTKSGAVGGTGLMGINPVNFKAYGVTNPSDPAQSINAGAAILSGLLDKYPDVQTALTHYVGGDDPKQWGPQTAAYPAKVLSAAGIGAPLPSAPAMLPGIPTSQSAAPQSDDAIFAQFSKGAAPANAQQGPQSDDAIFASMTKAAPAAPATTPAPPTQQTQAPQGSQPGMLASLGAGLGRGVQETALGAQQLLGHGMQALGGIGESPTLSGLITGQQPKNFIGRAGDWLVNDANQGLARGAQQVAPYSAAHSTVTGAGQIAGSMAATAPLLMAAPATATLGGAMAQGVGMGALIGGLSPVGPDSQDFTSDKLRQMGVGALLGGVTPAAVAGAVGAGRYLGSAAGSLVRPFTQGGRQQIARDIITQAGRGGPTSLDLSQIVPSSTPTLAEATGNPGIATLQRTIRDINPNPFVAQEQQNASARLSQLQSALGSPQELEAAQAATRTIAGDLGGAVAFNGVTSTPALNEIMSRPVMAPILKNAEKSALNTNGTNPFQAARDANAAQRVAQFQAIAGSPAALDAAREARDTMANALYSQANAQTFPVDSALNTLLQRPSMQQAIARAQKLASETGQPLKVGVDIPAKTTQSTILNAQGEPAFSIATPASQASYSGRALNYIKMGLDDLISSGAQTGGIIGHEKSALNSTKGDLLNWMDSQSPVYQQARQTYAQMSEPINAMETLQGLNLTDASGAIVPSKIDSAIKSIQSAQADNGISAAKSVTSQQLNALSSLRDDVNADRVAPIPPNLGPAALGHIQTEITNSLNNGKALTPEAQQSLQEAQNEILTALQQKNPQAIGARSNVPGTSAGNFMGPVTLPQQAQMQARSAQSMEILRGMNLTDASDNVTLAKVQNALKSLQKQGLQADPQKMAALVAVRDDLLRASNAGLGRSVGSSTAQNLATQQMFRNVLPGKLGALAGKLPAGTAVGALGGLVGYGAAGAPGAAVGGAIGARVGSGLSALMNSHNEAIQNEVANMLLNPAAVAPAFNGTASRALPLLPDPGLQRLLYPAVVNGGVRSLGNNRRP